ncbi:MAG: carboxypeptidase-like regulatory domain-containing protein [Burkholderiales bacterium]|nr:carboxypeptidase-like regulatory domain-containing protein [Burkholderiales bacterium]
MELATFKKLVLASAIAGMVTIYGCGGGGGGAATPATPAGSATISGVAATGAPFANAAVTLTDAAGVVKTATTGADGSYTIDVTGLTAPFVIKVSGDVGDANQTLVSV